MYEPYLAHYGVKGMKWGVRKDRDKGSSRRPRSPDSDDKAARRTAKREAKAQLYRDKAGKIEAYRRDIESRGKDAAYIRKKYGTTIDSKSSCLMIYGKTPAQILAKENKSLEKQRDKASRAAEAKLAGKLTSREKVLVGAGALVAIGLGSMVYGHYAKEGMPLTPNMANQRYLKSWMKKHADPVKLSDLSDDDLVIPMGTTFHRLAAETEKTVTGRLYAAYKPQDVTRYRALYGMQAKLRQGGSYLVSRKLQAAEPVRSPSPRKRVQILADMMSRNPQYAAQIHQMVLPLAEGEAAGRFRSAYTSFKLGKTSAEELAGVYYSRFAALGFDQSSSPINAYFSEVINRGYNAVVDDNDAGTLASTPIILLGDAMKLTEVGSERLDWMDLARDKLKIKAI